MARVFIQSPFKQAYVMENIYTAPFMDFVINKS